MNIVLYNMIELGDWLITCTCFISHSTAKSFGDGPWFKISIKRLEKPSLQRPSGLTTMLQKLLTCIWGVSVFVVFLATKIVKVDHPSFS